MEKIGFFTTDPSEPSQALEEQVFVKKLMGAPAGLEIAPAGSNPGVGAGLRRASASVRLDIPMLWRALIERPRSKKSGPVVAIWPPRGTAPVETQAKLGAGGVHPPSSSVGEQTFDIEFPPGTAPNELVTFAVQALQAIGGLGTTGEWQWTVRGKGLVPQ